MPSDPYYKTPHWKKLRTQPLALDGHRYVVPSCGQRTVDQIKRSRDGGADAIENTRSLRDEHDRSIKEMSKGQRRNRRPTHRKGLLRRWLAARSIASLVHGRPDS